MHVFVCGNPAMVGAPRRGTRDQLVHPTPGGVIELLEARGFTPDGPDQRGNVHYEAFWWQTRAVGERASNPLLA